MIMNIMDISKKKKIISKKFTWYDTGQIENLYEIRKNFNNKNKFNILEKQDEHIWFENNRVIKFSTNNNFISNRVKRASSLYPYVPKILEKNNNMYCYKKIKGNVLSEVITIDLFEKLLKHCQLFWERKNLNEKEKDQFQRNCLNFYKNKTYERIKLFYEKFDKKDTVNYINNSSVKSLSKALEEINWNDLKIGLPGRFHGDFHFENILFNTENEKFIFIDWRQDFAGNLNIGDIYYDLSKLLHGLIINHEIINKNLFSVDWINREINYFFERKEILIECEDFFYKWCEQNAYSVKKIKTITSLIFLNIASLHHYPYCLLLYGLGTKMLNDLLKKESF